MLNRLPLFALLAACNTFDNVEEACLDEVPGGSELADLESVEVASRLNCYRRIAKASKVRIDRHVQTAVVGHTNYLDQNTPIDNVFSQLQGNPGYTGQTLNDRLTAAGYTQPANTSAQQIWLGFSGQAAEQISGGDHFDYWFANPFVRPSFLEPVVDSVGLDVGGYVYTPDENTGIDPYPVAYTYYNLIYGYSNPVVAEIPKVYPRKGQIDAPGEYLHLSEGDGLEFGRTYGYPITFTVGSRETGFTVDQAIVAGPNGTVPFQLIFGSQGTGGFEVQNSAILVPDEPLIPGATYRARVQLTTDQGTRVAKTEFTVGPDTRPIPQAYADLALRRLEEAGDELPVLTYHIGAPD